MDKAPTLSDLEYFINVVTSGSLTRASKNLRVQQSTLTISLQRLEKISGTNLLVRTKKGVQPTQMGKIFLEKGKLLLEQWSALKDEMSGEETFKHRILFGCHQSTGLYTLKHFLPIFLKENIHIDLVIQHDYTAKIIQNVLNYHLDFGLGVNPLAHKELEIIPLYKTYVGLFESKVTKNINKNILLYDPEMYGIELFLAKLQKCSHRFERFVPISSLETIASLAISGAGKAILPGDTASSLGSKDLELTWAPADIAEFEVSLFYRKEIQNSHASLLFIDSIKKTLTSKSLISSINSLNYQ
jgi:DNA-binding transcriptional LysR family regulator